MSLQFIKLKPLSLFLALSTFAMFPSFGQQEGNEVPPEEIETYKQESEALARFFEFTLNTLGDTATTAQEKDIIINQSYLKIFRDDEVQIEDDLIEGREVVTNKDVQAYLKDVDFFFKYSKFEFNIQEVDHFVNDEGQLYFKVSINRNLQAITLEDDTININKDRYIEINLDRENKDLRIVSIYTTRLSEDEELNNWWSTLSYEWQAVFKRELAVLEDSLSLSQLQRVVNMETLDLSGNKGIKDLGPIGKLSDLKSLNISNTNVTDLSPIRNLTKLEVFDCSQNLISSLAALKYSINLQELYCNSTLITDLSSVKNFPKLEKLYCYTSPITSLAPLASLKKLKDLRFFDTRITDLTPLASITTLELLNFSYTKTTDLQPLGNLKNLERLYIENTPITDLTPLKGCRSLKMIFCNNSTVGSLAPLAGLPSLEKVYCDNTRITKDVARQFMQQNKNVLVIYESEALQQWWTSLSPAWKGFFGKKANIGAQATNEQLQQAVNIAEIDITGIKEIRTLAPLTMMIYLSSLKCSGTGINDLAPLTDLIDLQFLDIANTAVTSVSPLSNLNNLKTLHMQGTKVADLSPLAKVSRLEVLNCENTPATTLLPLQELAHLKAVYCDGTPIPATAASAFVMDNPEVLVVFQTEALTTWWGTLDAEWQAIFREQTTVEPTPTREQLHSVTTIQSLNISGKTSIRKLEPISGFLLLKDLQMSGTRVSNLAPVTTLLNLENLNCSQNPIVDISPLQEVSTLKVLDLSNTGVEELESLASLPNLETLTCSGTPIRKLNALASIKSLKEVAFFSTSINNLNPLLPLPSLELVECYNTRLNAKKVDKFKKSKPSVEVVFY